MNDSLRLRPVEASDLPLMFQMQLDPESNRMAVTFPRTQESFDAHWAASLGDPTLAARVILLGEETIGYISCFSLAGNLTIGYLIIPRYWGLGFATRALQMLLAEVPTRPLFAHAASSNIASIRVLQKCGFVIEKVQWEPAGERHPAGEVAHLKLT